MKPSNQKNLPVLGRILLITESEVLRKRLVAGLAIFCAVLFLLDFLHLRHGKFSIEGAPGFYGVFGFLAFAFIIFATKGLKRLLSREENYYGDSGTESEEHPVIDLDVKEHGDD